MKFSLLKALIIIYSFFVSSSAAQQSTKVVEASGDVIVANISPQQARYQALMLAKSEALLEAGIAEDINSVQALLTSNDDVMFSQVSSIELRGTISSYKILEESLTVAPDGTPHYIVKIRARTMPYVTVHDPEFDIEVRGVDPKGYISGKKLAFEVRPTKDCYLNIFLLENVDTGDMLFPTPQYEPRRIFTADQTVLFPTNRTIQYTMLLSDKTVQSEKNHLVVVATKANIQYTDAVNYENLTQWLYKIEPSQRVVMSLPIVIVK